MRSELQQAGVGQQSVADVRQNALVEQQAQLIRHLVDLEATQTSYTKSLAGATPQERKEIDFGLRDTERQIISTQAVLAETNLQIAQAQGEGLARVGQGTSVQPSPEGMFGLNRGEFGGIAGFILLFPIALAAARMLWRRGSAGSAPRDSESATRLARLEQAVESVAIEVERIGESQRFNTRLLTERPSEMGSVSVGESARPVGDIRR